MPVDQKTSLLVDGKKQMARKLDGWMAKRIEEQIARRLEDNKTPIQSIEYGLSIKKMKQTRDISRNPIFWPFQDLKQANLSRKNIFRPEIHDEQLDIITINQNMHYQRRQMNQNRDISQKPIFWTILALKWVKQSHINLSQTRICLSLIHI